MAAPHLAAPDAGTGRHALRSVDDLYAWQSEALEQWELAGTRGIVEAVTGAGKTRLALAAADRAIRDGLRVLVLVPTKELRDQWVRECTEHLPRARIGLFDSDHDDFLDDHDVVVALVHSACKYWILPDGYRGLLIADECHRYATRTFSEALDERFERRLGISATYERDDGAHVDYLDSYFGGRVYRLWYERALADGVVAPFDIALVGVEFGPREQAAYDEHSDGIDRATRRLRHLGIRAEDMGPVDHLRLIGQLAAATDGRPENFAARRYMMHFGRRRSLLAENDAKRNVLQALAPVVREARGSLVFTQTRTSAESAADLFRSLGITTTAIFGEMDKNERKSRMTAFRTEQVALIAAPRILDEGVDVPEADLGIVVSANRSRRQIVQRLGRVIRPKVDGRPGRLVQLYVASTVEDPAVYGDEHLKDVLPHARCVDYFDSSTPEELLEFLRRPAPPLRTYQARHSASSSVAASGPRPAPVVLLHPAGAAARDTDRSGYLRGSTWHQDPHCVRLAGLSLEPIMRSSDERHSLGAKVRDCRRCFSPPPKDTSHDVERAPRITRSAKQLEVPAYRKAETCSSCGGTVSMLGLCRCS